MQHDHLILKHLTDSSVIFWDFDGVIKDSVSVKSDAFEKLFSPFGSELATKVRDHHELNSGISRFDKIPIYLEWVGEELTPNNINIYCDKFSKIVMQEVIDSKWVPGVIEFIRSQYSKKKLFLVTATPQQEIEKILDELCIRQYFKEVYGAPMHKVIAIGDIIKRFKINKSRALMVGDAETDYKAAVGNDIKFILRCTQLNKNIQETYGLIGFNELKIEDDDE